MGTSVVRLLFLIAHAAGCGRIGFDARGQGPDDPTGDGGIDPGTSSITVSACSVDGWCWENPVPFGSRATAIAGSAPNDVWIGGEFGVIVHWDGSELAQVPSGVTTELVDMWAASASDAWAVGNGGTILHWNGTVWSPVASGTTTNLTAVWGSGPTDVWAVGPAGTVIRWNGMQWNLVASGSPPRDWFAVGGSAPNDVWIAGASGVIRRYDGTSFTELASPTSNTLTTVHVSATNDAWVAGGAGLIAHWDGASWTPASGITEAVADVAVVADQVLATGSALYRWSGTAFEAVPGATSVVGRLWSAGANDVWSLSSSRITRWNGVDATPLWASAGGSEWLYGIAGSSAIDIWAVGSGTILHRDAAGWRKVDGGSYFAVTSLAADDAWAVGVAALGNPANIAHWDGTQWTPVANEIFDALHAVWGSAANDVWAAGSNGAIARWDGTAWTRIASGTTDALVGVWGSGPNDVWIVGESTAMLHWNGSALESVPRGTAAQLTSISGTGPDDVWAVGNATTLHWDGVAWTPISNPAIYVLNAVWAVAPDAVWAGGTRGFGLGVEMIEWDGVSWRRVQTGAPLQFMGLWGTKTNNDIDVWSVGLNGQILRHRR